MVIAIDRGS